MTHEQHKPSPKVRKLTQGCRMLLSGQSDYGNTAANQHTSTHSPLAAETAPASRGSPVLRYPQHGTPQFSKLGLEVSLALSENLWPGIRKIFQKALHKIQQDTARGIRWRYANIPWQDSTRASSSNRLVADGEDCTSSAGYAGTQCCVVQLRPIHWRARQTVQKTHLGTAVIEGHTGAESNPVFCRSMLFVPCSRVEYRSPMSAGNIPRCGSRALSASPKRASESSTGKAASLCKVDEVSGFRDDGKPAL